MLERLPRPPILWRTEFLYRRPLLPPLVIKFEPSLLVLGSNCGCCAGDSVTVLDEFGFIPCLPKIAVTTPPTFILPLPRPLPRPLPLIVRPLPVP